MSGKVVVLFALLAALLVSTAASSPGETKETRTLQQLLAQRQRARESSVRQELAPQAFSARTERRTPLSEDDREIMTKQIMQAISEMMSSDCMSSRDYQGWVDFGRREAE
ncbi:hypothetical protein Q5P01_026240 [Channa striata]|uniref:Gastrin/cholecystokinin peptide hormone domain-containing protein n=1 Tax=Channa striata TaxID=64152 RepID=A0AA88IG06_CHASR|nr:hypothetical protein Q5P01_026240 [Channa striata]